MDAPACSELLKELAGPGERGDRTKAAINRAARLAGLDYWRAFNLWYGKVKRVEAVEADAIRDALRVKREEAACNDIYKLQLQIEQLKSRLVQTSANIDRARLNPPRLSGGEGRRDYGALDRALAAKR